MTIESLPALKHGKHKQWGNILFGGADPCTSLPQGHCRTGACQCCTRRQRIDCTPSGAGHYRTVTLYCLHEKFGSACLAPAFCCLCWDINYIYIIIKHKELPWSHWYKMSLVGIDSSNGCAWADFDSQTRISPSMGLHVVCLRGPFISAHWKNWKLDWKLHWKNVASNLAFWCFAI